MAVSASRIPSTPARSRPVRSRRLPSSNSVGSCPGGETPLRSSVIHHPHCTSTTRHAPKRKKCEEDGKAENSNTLSPSHFGHPVSRNRIRWYSVNNSVEGDTSPQLGDCLAMINHYHATLLVLGFIIPHARPLFLFCVLLVHIDHLLHLALAAHEDAAAIVDVFGDDFHHPPHMTVDCETAS